MISEFIAFMQGCPYISDATSSICVDREGGESGVSVSQSGNRIVRKFKDGSTLVERDLILYFAQNADNDEQRIDNNDLLDHVFDWVLSQTARRNYPNFGEGRRCISLTASNGMLYDSEDEGAAIYQMQFKLQYYQKGDMKQ